MSTFIDGIGQCQVIDKSGEMVDLKGHDITSLDKTGTFTWEHQANTPATLVGKILKAKKIYSKDDCENDRELYYWNKCKTPYLYVMGELLDDYTASAKECAGQMKYSRDKPNLQPLLGFSIEGSELPNSRTNSKMVISRSIGRKVTLTQSPCNSACIAEIYETPKQKSQIKDDFDFLFKTTEQAINLFKSGEGEKIYEQYLAKREPQAPPAPKDPYNEYENKGIRAGTTRSGTHTFSHGTTREYKFNPQEHQEGGEFHEHASVIATNPKLGDNKAGRQMQHKNAVASGGRVENRAALSLNDKSKISTAVNKNPIEKNENMLPKNKGIKIGTTSTGKDVHSHGKVGEYGFNSGEHKEAGEFHRKAAVEAKNAKAADHHIEKMKLHNQSAITTGRVENRSNRALATKRQAAVKEAERQKLGKSEKCTHKKIKKDDMTAPPPEPNQANAAAMQSGATSGFSMKQGMANLASGLGLGKAETPNWSKGKVAGGAVHYSHPEHGVVSIQKQPSGSFDVKHQGKIAGVGGIKGSFSNPKEAGAHAQKYMQGISAGTTAAPKMHNISSQGILGKSDLKKAIEAGSYNAAPSTLVNGAAYQTESLGSKQATTGAEDHTFHGTKKKAKKDWNKQAKDDYERWPHREKFEKFMKARMPHLADGEIKAIGKTLALKKSIDFEKALGGLVSFNKGELDEKTLIDIQKETAEKWADRAEEAYGKAIAEKSIKWLLESEELFHEAIEHSSLSEDLATFEKIRARLIPIRKKALKLLAPGSEA